MTEEKEQILFDFIDWFGTWQTDKHLPDYGINDILEAYQKHEAKLCSCDFEHKHTDCKGLCTICSKPMEQEYPEILRYKCATCGNRCLQDYRPDNSICGGCKNPDCKLMKFQEAYMVDGKDFIHEKGEI